MIITKICRSHRIGIETIDFFIGNEQVYIPQKELGVLIVLLESAGHVVLKDMIIESVWKNIIVSDESLTRCIYSLRCIFEKIGYDRCIETIYRKGYRFSGQDTLQHQCMTSHYWECLCRRFPLLCCRDYCCFACRFLHLPAPPHHISLSATPPASGCKTVRVY